MLMDLMYRISKGLATCPLSEVLPLVFYRESVPFCEGILLDYIYRYQNSPDLRLTWLQHMAEKHTSVSYC